MIDLQTAVKHFQKGQPTKYREQKHIELLLKTFFEGEGIMAFCAEALIAKQTFYTWLEAYPKFKDAYGYALTVAGKRWENLPLHNPNINYAYWRAVMRNRFGYFNVRLSRAKDVTPRGRFEAIWSDLEEGNLTSGEAMQIASIANTEANIINNTPQEDSTATKLMTIEEIQTQIMQIENIEERLE